ncbi:MAG: Bug family tripartite tricarboxylate transporter substrate binding protein [Burkholderiales bacterium]
MRMLPWRVLATMFCLVAQAATADYPDKALRLIAPFSPGGATDVMARITAEQLAVRLGRPVIVDNRPGYGGNLGAELASRAAPDGYTLLMGPASIYAISATLYPKLGYRLEDLKPVSLVANAPHVLLVHPGLEVRNVQELIALAKKRPGELNVASQGNGTVSHLEAALFDRMAGTQMLHVPYKGSTPALGDLLGGRVQVMFDSIAASIAHVRSGRLRAIAVTATTRSPLLPQVPTLDESGLKGYQAHSWLGVFAPAGTPNAILDRLQREIASALADPAVRDKFLANGLEPRSSTSAEFAAFIREEITKWAPVVKYSGATPD